jgi:rRNA processing protein Gar1
MYAHGQGWQENLAHCTEKERLMDRDERLKELDDKYEDYAIYDNVGEKIGKVDDVFID